MWKRGRGEQSQGDFESLTDLTANVKFTQSQENNGMKNDRDSDFLYRKYNSWFLEKTWEELKLGNKTKVKQSNMEQMTTGRNENTESNSMLTKFFTEKIIEMTTKFSDFEKRFTEIEGILENKLNKMEKILICGQEIVDRRLLEIENALVQKIIEKIDEKLNSMNESLRKRQKKWIERQNVLNEKINVSLDMLKIDDKLQQMQTSIKTQLEDTTNEIHGFFLAEKSLKSIETGSKDCQILCQNKFKTIKSPEHQVPFSPFAPFAPFAPLPSPAISANDFLSKTNNYSCFKKPQPQITFRKRHNTSHTSNVIKYPIAKRESH